MSLPYVYLVIQAYLVYFKVSYIHDYMYYDMPMSYLVSVLHSLVYTPIVNVSYITSMLLNRICSICA